MVSFSWLFAYYLRFYEIKLIPVTKGLPPIRGYLYLLVFLLLITGWIFKSFKLYVPRRHSLDIDEFFCIVKATVSLMVIIGFITFFYRDYSYSRVVMAYFCIVNIASMTVARGTIRKILKFFRKRGGSSFKEIAEEACESHDSDAPNLYQYKNDTFTEHCKIAGCVKDCQSGDTYGAGRGKECIDKADRTGCCIGQH